MSKNNRFIQKTLAAFMAVVTTATPVATSVFASDTADTGSTAEAVEIAPVVESQSEEIEVETEAAVSESSNETAETADTAGATEAAPAEEAEEVRKDETEKTESTSDDKSDAGETSDAEKGEDAEKADAEEQKDTKEESVESAETEEIKKSRVAFRFNDGAGTVKVVISSDEGASKEDPSITVKKDVEKDAEAEFRNDDVKALALNEGRVEDNTLELNLAEGTKVNVIAKTADGYKADEYSITEGDGEKEAIDFNAEAEEFEYEFSVADKAVLFEAKASVIETAVAEELAKFGLKLDSAGGNVTIDVTDKDGNVTTYTVSKDSEGNVTVTGGEAAAEEGFALSLEAEEGTNLTITAKADGENSISKFAVVTPDGNTEDVEPETSVDEATGATVKAGTVSKTIAFAKGMTTAEISFNDMPEFNTVAKAGKLTVKIHAAEGILPAGTVAEVKELDADAKKEFAEKAAADAGSEELFVAAAVDITFKDKDGNEIQPAGMVDVIFEDMADDKDVTVYHATDDEISGVEKVESKKVGSDITISNDKFSPYGVLKASGRNTSEPNWSAFAKGTRKHLDNTKFVLDELDGFVYKYNYIDGDPGDGWTACYSSYLYENGKSSFIGYSVCFDPRRDGTGMEGWTTDNVYSFDADMLVKALYYGIGGGKNVLINILKQGNPDETDSADSYARLNIVTHAAASELYAHMGWAKKSDAGDAFRMGNQTGDLKKDTYAFINAIAGLDTPDDYYVYLAGFNDPERQDFGVLSKVVLEPQIKIKVTKKSSKSDMTDGNPCYSFAGAEFAIKDKDGKTVATLTSDKNGNTPESIELPLGNYTVVETKAPDGYKLNSTPVKVNATKYQKKAFVAEIADKPLGDPIIILINKYNNQEKTLDPNDILPLSGAVFKVTYYKAHLGADDFNADGTAKSAKVDRTWYIKTKKTPAGKYRTSFSEEYLDTEKTNSAFYMDGSISVLPLGTFTIKEESAPVGYKNDGKFGNVDFYIGQVVWNDKIKDTEVIDIQGKRTTDNSEETLSVAETPIPPEVKTTVKADASKTRMVFASEPVEITITDTVHYENLYPGKKYTLNGKVVDKDAASAIDASTQKELFEKAEALNDADGNPITGTQTFVADASGKGDVDVKITFKVDPSYLNRTYVTLEEAVPETGTPLYHADINDKPQTFVTPEIGTTASEFVFDNENGTSMVTLDDVVDFKRLDPSYTYQIKGTLYDKETGEQVLVGGKPVTAETSFTPEGEKDEEGYVSGSTTVQFKFDAMGFDKKEFVVFEEVYVNGGLVASHKDIEDEKQSVKFPEPTGHTNANDSLTEDKIAADVESDEVTVNDVFTYENLIPGTTYTMNASVVRKDNGEVIKSAITGMRSDECEFVDAPAQENTDEQNAEAPADGQDTEAPASDEQGTDVPATDTEGGEEAPSTYITDGKFYFIPRKTSGSITIDLLINKADLKGQDVVVFENVKRDDVDIIIHEDIEDENQTVHIPDGGTKARDQITGQQVGKAEGIRIIEDDLEYQNLIPGKEYTIKGVVMLQPAAETPVKEDGTEETTAEGDGAISIDEAAENGAVPLEGAQMVDKDGNDIEAYTFTAAEKDGIETLYFRIDASNLAGRTIVLFETVEYKEVPVIVHADINDKEEYVHYPSGSTTATDAKTKTHTSLAEKEAVINDVLAYHNLIPNKEYVAHGTLMDKATKKPVLVDGKEITAEVAFTPAEADGEVVIPFKFDSSLLAGRTVVAFEKVTLEGAEVFAHEDITDEAQTVYIPKIGTTATDKADGDHTLATSGNVTVEDKVDYTNLDTEKTYKVIGTLVDKKTEKRVGVDGKVITNSKTFTPDAKNGSIVVPLTFNVTNVKSGEYVVYEEVYEINKETGKENLVAIHNDPNDKNQTVKVPERPSKRVQTGDFPVVPVAVGGAIVLIAAGVLFVVLGKKKKS